MGMDSPVKEHVKIDKISIEQFRRFENVEFEISKNITLIAGQNGISKSTLLGMLCQPFSFGVRQGRKAGSPDKSKYIENYHGINLAEYYDLRGRPFFYDCEDVFRLSRLHDTLTKKYNYRLHLSGNCINKNSPIFKGGLFVRATKRKSEGKERIRFVAGPGASQEAGEGNFPHPVIYLGLNRLWPLALLKKLDVKETPDITGEDKKWYIKKYNEILVLDEHDNTTEFLKTGNVQRKDFIGTSSSDYNSESCSAGQDNLGQILTSILSFKHLKSKLRDKYQGGVLLIDEVDATFHAVAQTRIIETLNEASEELNLQVIATTHSMHLLKYIYHSNLKNKVKILYLKKNGNKTIDSGYTTIEEIKDDLNVEATPVPRKKTKKVSIFFEDSVGKNMFFGIVGNSLSKYLNCVERENFDAGSLKNLAVLAVKVPELWNVIFIPDGDIKKQFEHSIHKNVLFLPGESRPETVIYENLKDTEDDDPFWKKCNAKYKNYNRQFAITKEGPPPEPSTSGDAKKCYKQWYKKQRPFWGQMENIVYT
jgi:predicted ATPase